MKDILKKILIGSFMSILVFSIGEFTVNNILIHRTETKNIECTVSDINRRVEAIGKVATTKYRLYTEELNYVITTPRAVIRDMYRDKDKYIGSKINIVEVKGYNRKNKLIGVGYKLK